MSNKMKKPLLTVLAVALAVLLPMESMNAQEKRIQLGIKTLDHAQVLNARIYAGVLGTCYYVDASCFDANYHQPVMQVSNIATSSELTVASDGYTVLGAVDSTIYAMSFIVIGDVNGHYYVLGNTEDADSGVVKVDSLFDGIASGDTLNNGHVAMNPLTNMLMFYGAPITDNDGWLYASLTAAVATPSAFALTFTDTVRVDTTVTISGATRTLNINHNGNPIVNTSATGLFVISNDAQVTISGGSGAIRSNILSGNATQAGPVYKIVDASVVMSHLNVTSNESVIEMEGSSAIYADQCNFQTTGTNDTVMLMDGASLATIGADVEFEGGAYGVSMASSATGRLDINTTTVLNNMTDYDVPVDAYGYANTMSNQRSYWRSLKQAAFYSDTIYLGRKMSSPVSDSIHNSVVLMLGSDSIMSELKVRHTMGTVEINGGVINSLLCDNTTASVVLQDIDSLGSLEAGNHEVNIVSGRYGVITPLTGADITINGGKYTQEYPNYLAPRHTFMPNTDPTDSLTFKKVVVPGYKVNYVNYDYKGHDTLIVYNNANNKISPALSSPRYPDHDTVFMAWCKDSALTTEWIFEDDLLTQDTTLYAHWHRMVPTERTCKIIYKHIGLTNDTTAVDSINAVCTIGERAVFYSRFYVGRSATEDSIVFAAMPDHDTTIYFLYTLNTYYLTWDADGGHFSDNASTKVDTLKYTQTITLPEEPAKEGFSFSSWTQLPAGMTMIARNHTCTAQYEPRTYALTWIGADTSVVYTTEAVTCVSASYVDDNSNTVQAQLSYYKIDGTPVSQAVAAGRYRVVAAPQNPVYTLEADTVKYFTVTKAEVSVDAATVEFDSVKFNDGTSDVNVTNIGTLTGVLGNDMVMHNTTARYSDATSATGKSIIAYFSLVDGDTANYTLDTNAALLTTNGVIMDSITLNSDYAEQGIAVNVKGYCTGGDTIRYDIQNGAPDEYNLIFSSADVTNQHFTNAGWTAIDPSNPGIILVDIPAEAAMGDYTVALLFRNSAYPDLTSDTARFQIHINLPRTYTMPLFDDVIALVDTCHCFTDIHWYHSTDGGATWNEVTEAQGKYYYQEEGGLTGEYYVVANMNGVATRTCVQSDMETQISDEAPATPAVTAYPNPTVDRVTVSIANSDARSHTVRVMNVMGVTTDEVTFDGDNTTLDFSRYANGSYTISVDGIAVRVIKK